MKKKGILNILKHFEFELSVRPVVADVPRRHIGPSTSAPAHRPQHMGPSTWAPAHGPQHVRPRLRPSRVGRRRPKDYSIRGRRQFSSVIVSIRQYFDSSATVPKVYGWNFTCKNN